ncbi:MAG TPA: hypothetical protein VNL13_01465 [Sulfolobales archaeon]|nr:hypothetical protein [Sulfolobales archaeon]
MDRLLADILGRYLLGLANMVFNDEPVLMTLDSNRNNALSITKNGFSVDGNPAPLGSIDPMNPPRIETPVRAR